MKRFLEIKLFDLPSCSVHGEEVDRTELSIAYDDFVRQLVLFCQKEKNIIFLCFTADNIIATRKNSRVDLYLRIRRIKSRFSPDCLIIARLSFSKERLGHGTHFIRFLTGIAPKHGFNHIGIEYTNAKSSAFAKKLVFLLHRWGELRNSRNQSNILFFNGII